MELISKDDAIAVAMYSKDPVEGIKNLPTVDPAAEVRHGRWKYFRKQNIAVCTNCSFERDFDVDFGRAVSCPNCGTNMDFEG